MSKERFDAQHIQAGFQSYITDMDKVLFVSNGGFIGGMVQPTLFSRAHNAYEMAWYAEDGSGLKLLAALTNWAKKMRAKELFVHHYSGAGDIHQFKKVMARKKFNHVGSCFSLPIESI